MNRPDQAPPFISHADAPYRGRSLLAGIAFCAAVDIAVVRALLWWLA